MSGFFSIMKKDEKRGPRNEVNGEFLLYPQLNNKEDIDMSWDLFILNIPSDITTMDDVPKNHEFEPLGLRTTLSEKIISILPETNFDDPTWGAYSTSTYQLEFSMGDDEICSGIMIHLRGDDQGLKCIDSLLNRLELRGVDMQTGQFFDLHIAHTSFKQFEVFKDRFKKTLE